MQRCKDEKFPDPIKTDFFKKDESKVSFKIKFLIIVTR